MVNGKGNNEGKVLSINISKEKGEIKNPVEKAKIIKDQGIQNDVHSGQPVKQISIMEQNIIRDFEKKHQLDLMPGDFAENLTTKGLEISKLKVGTKLLMGEEILLQVSQIGKKCHDDCAIKDKTGHCLMPEKGIFCRVLEGGPLKRGDKIKILDEERE